MRTSPKFISSDSGETPFEGGLEFFFESLLGPHLVFPSTDLFGAFDGAFHV